MSPIVSSTTSTTSTTSTASTASTIAYIRSNTITSAWRSIDDLIDERIQETVSDMKSMINLMKICYLYIVLVSTLKYMVGYKLIYD